MKLTSAALTDIGRVRRRNEDSYLADNGLRAFGVADGIGGLPGGAAASQATVESLRSAIGERQPRQASDLVPLVHDINQRVSDLGVELSPNTGIGTTLTFGVFVPFRLLLAHVGDSRCYRIRRGRIEPLTEDHSVENEARHRRARGQSAEYSERFRHALTRCIGQPTEPEVDVSEQALEAGDLYLFASDGVTRVLTEPEVAETLSAKGSLKDRLDNLIRRVLERGAPDNATAVVVEVVEPN